MQRSPTITNVVRLAVAAAFAAWPGSTAGAQVPAPGAPVSVVSSAPASPAAADFAQVFDTTLRLLRQNYVAETAAAVDWDALEKELRPRAVAAASPEALREVLRDLVGRVGQSHFAVLPPSAAPPGSSATDSTPWGSAGLDIALVEGGLVVTRVAENGPAARAGFRPGWSVNEIGGRSASQILSDLPATLPAPARAFQAAMAANALQRGPVGSPVTLAVTTGGGEARDVSLTREAERGETVRFGLLPPLQARLDSDSIVRGGRTIGVIRFNIWMTPIARELDEAVDRLRGSDGMIIDLRGNPGGVMTMVMGVAGHFLATPVNLGTVRTRDSELRLVANPRLVSVDGRPVQPFAGRLAILVDETSYSASEIFAGGMQAIGRARVFGSRTPGGALPAVLERLPGGDVLQYPIGDFVTGRGDRLEGRGVIPDEAVPVTRAALVNGRDDVLEAAVRWVVEGP